MATSAAGDASHETMADDRDGMGPPVVRNGSRLGRTGIGRQTRWRRDDQLRSGRRLARRLSTRDVGAGPLLVACVFRHLARDRRRASFERECSIAHDAADELLGPGSFRFELRSRRRSSREPRTDDRAFVDAVSRRAVALRAAASKRIRSRQRRPRSLAIAVHDLFPHSRRPRPRWPGRRTRSAPEPADRADASRPVRWHRSHA